MGTGRGPVGKKGGRAGSTLRPVGGWGASLLPWGLGAPAPREPGFGFPPGPAGVHLPLRGTGPHKRTCPCTVTPDAVRGGGPGPLWSKGTWAIPGGGQHPVLICTLDFVGLCVVVPLLTTCCVPTRLQEESPCLSLVLTVAGTLSGREWGARGSQIQGLVKTQAAGPHPGFCPWWGARMGHARLLAETLGKPRRVVAQVAPGMQSGILDRVWEQSKDTQRLPRISRVWGCAAGPLRFLLGFEVQLSSSP